MNLVSNLYFTGFCKSKVIQGLGLNLNFTLSILLRET